jgi:hypothetical protein
MAGNSNFPTALDDDTSLLDVTDGVSTLQAVHHNNVKEALKAIEAKLGIYGTASPTSLDYRLGHHTGGHQHNGASGMGRFVDPTNIKVPSGGFPSGLSLHEHFLDRGLHQIERWTSRIELVASAAVGSNISAPIVIGRTGQIENVSAVLRRGPSGATTAFKILVGPTDIWGASVGLGIRFAPGATRYGQPSSNLTTYPSGAIITLDATEVGSNEPGQGLSVVFVFRD